LPGTAESFFLLSFTLSAKLNSYQQPKPEVQNKKPRVKTPLTRDFSLWTLDHKPNLKGDFAVYESIFN
jgi:hypothetical protein